MEHRSGLTRIARRVVSGRDAGRKDQSEQPHSANGQRLAVGLKRQDDIARCQRFERKGRFITIQRLQEDGVALGLKRRHHVLEHRPAHTDGPWPWRALRPRLPLAKRRQAGPGKRLGLVESHVLVRKEGVLEWIERQHDDALVGATRAARTRLIMTAPVPGRWLHHRAPGAGRWKARGV